MTDAKTLNLTYHQDPGHGWVEVPQGLLRELGIAEKVTPYSYRNHETVYLEEDCDATLFLNTAKDAGLRVTLTEKHVNIDHPIRNLSPYRA